MHRLNLTIDESLYEQAKLHSFESKKSISQIVREGLSLYLAEETIENIKDSTKEEVYDRLGEAMKEVKLMIDGKIPKRYARDSIAELKNELENS